MERERERACIFYPIFKLTAIIFATTLKDNFGKFTKVKGKRRVGDKDEGEEGKGWVKGDRREGMERRKGEWKEERGWFHLQLNNCEKEKGEGLRYGRGRGRRVGEGEEGGGELNKGRRKPGRWLNTILESRFNFSKGMLGRGWVEGGV